MTMYTLPSVKKVATSHITLLLIKISEKCSIPEANCYYLATLQHKTSHQPKQTELPAEKIYCS